MFSRRVRLEAKNRQTLLLEEKRQKGEPILDLTESNPTRAGFSYPEEAIQKALTDTRSQSYEPSPFGHEEARRAVALYYAGRGQEIPPQDILLTVSTSEAYSYLFKLLADPGEHVLVPRPSYPLFEFLASGEGVKTVSYPLFYDQGWELHADAVGRRITCESKVVVVVHPNNPTGSFMKPEEWTPLKETCRRHGLPVICDEVFFDYLLDESVIPAQPLGQNEVLTFVLNGLSKLAGLPQMKLGWIIVRGPEKEKQAALERLEVICDSFLSVSTPIQRAAPALLQLRGGLQGQIRRRLQTNLALLRERVANTAISALAVEGGWSVPLRLPRIRSDEEWALELLDRQGVLAHPGYFFNFSEEAVLVISLLPDPGRFGEGIRRLVELAEAS